MDSNLILNTDSYKVSHYRQYPPGTTEVFSYFECRGGPVKDCVFFGLQYIIKKYLVGAVVTEEKIREAEEVYSAHFGDATLFNADGWRYIVRKHGGRLPIRIRAVPEGSIVPLQNALFTVENTDPNCAWLTNFLETLLVRVWYPITVATCSREQKAIIARYLDMTADTLNGLPFKLHDFGARGVSSGETCGVGAASHLVNFKGTDSITGIMMARQYYGESMAGFSIPATEHSTITSWGRDHELDAYRNILEKFPTGMVACVSDSYDVYRACEQLWGTDLRDMIVQRGEKGGTLVIRPDSGDPPEVVLKVLEILGRQFGTTTNSKGFKVLPSCVRVIQGDGINVESLNTILQVMAENKWSADNVAFGSGGALLQKLNRDTLKCAYKCSHATIDHQSVDVYKDPVTDPGKKSKKGRLALVLRNGEYVTVSSLQAGDQDAFLTVFENGELLVNHSFADIRARAELDLVKAKRN